MHRIGPKLAAFASLGFTVAAAGCGSTAAPEPDVRLTVLNGADQVGTVGQDLPTPLTVEVRDEANDNAPLANVVVTFLVETGGGGISVSGGVAAGNGAYIKSMTDPSGHATAVLALGPAAGAQAFRVSATYPGSDSTVLVSELATAGRVVRSGDGQVAAPGQTLPLDIGVIVADVFGNPVPGVVVKWSLSAGGGTISTDSVQTSDTGWASTRWTLGAAGPQEVLGDVAGAGVFSFAATAK